MIQESDILGYVKLCQQAEKNESPKGKIKAYEKIKELMYKDQEKALTKRRVSSVWIRYWLQAVESIHEHTDWRDDIDFRRWNEDHFEDIFNMEEIPEWIYIWTDTQYLWTRLHENIGPGSKMRENQSEQEGFQWMNNFFPPELNGNKPEVTPLDVVFYEMLTIIDGRFNYNARMAVVAGEYESEEDAKPSSEYIGANFLKTIAADFESNERELTEEEKGLIRKHDPRYEKPAETLKEATSRRMTQLPELEKKIREYMKRADGIERKTLDEERKLFALGQLLKYIDNENGAYVDDVEVSMKEGEDEIFLNFMRRWKLDAEKEDWEVGEAVRSFLEAAHKAINTKMSEPRLGGNNDFTDDFEWHPITELYSAQPMLYGLVKAIKEDIEYLRVQVNILSGRDISDQEIQALPHFNLNISETMLLSILEGLKNIKWKNNRVSETGLIANDVTSDEWLYIFQGHTEGRQDATRKITWKAKYACASFVKQFLNSDYETAENVFNLKIKNDIVDIKELKTTKINRNPDICDESTGKIAKIIREAMRKDDEVKSKSSSVK